MTQKTEILFRRHKASCNEQLQDFLPGISPADRREFNRSRTVKAALHSDRHLDRWITNKLLLPKLSVSVMSLHDLQGWSVDEATGNICQNAGKFFSLIGIHVRHRTPAGETEWDQPVIDQPEIGILGLIVKRINGVLHFCLQAKEEPGNINSVQLSPTVQATYSNYTRAHGGSLPKFAEYFLDPAKGRTIFAKLQTEDGGRFLYKSNRNMIVQVADEEMETLPQGFIWVTLRQIGRLLHKDNLIHACTRSILSALIFPAGVTGRGKSPARGVVNRADGSSPGEVVQWLDDQKAANHFLIKRRGLHALREWSMDRDGSYSHNDGRFFRVVGLDVKTSDREVSFWQQPILDNPGTGIIGILTKEENGERYFLLQAKAEPGNRGLVQLGPTVQFTPGNYIGNNKLPKPYLFDEFCCPEQLPLLHESRQSEEGARFYHETHIHRILCLPQGVELNPPAEFHWLSRAAIHFCLNLGETVNSCARSVLSLMLFEESGRYEEE
jgi:oxidase EvaA